MFTYPNLGSSRSSIVIVVYKELSVRVDRGMSLLLTHDNVNHEVNGDGDPLLWRD